jgi:hypothetical protein
MKGIYSPINLLVIFGGFTFCGFACWGGFGYVFGCAFERICEFLACFFWRNNSVQWISN